MKKTILHAGVLCAVCILGTPSIPYCIVSGVQPVHAASIAVSQTESSVLINDDFARIKGYNINGNNYFKLRDLASALNGTSCQFNVAWNKEKNQIEIITKQAYSAPNTDNQGTIIWQRQIQAEESMSQLLLDGKPINIKAYSIDGNNYYQLRELSNYIGYQISWLEEEQSICIYTESNLNTVLSEGGDGVSRFRTASESTSRWSHTNRNNMFSNDDGTFSVFEVGETQCVIDTYDKEYKLLKTNTIPNELQYFGGFLAGKEYNYVVFAQSNTEENNSKEVIRVVKYDKDFKRIDSLSITGGESFTIGPFASGSLRMAENGDQLTVHTTRKRYTTEDGLNHQSQLTIFVNTKSMKLENSLEEFQNNHVSHSFNQFVKYDGDDAVLVDHGDAYPRGIVLHKGQKNNFRKITLFDIPGDIGANCTGVTLGGFAISKNNYIVAINSIQHTNSLSYNSYSINGLKKDERDVILLVSGKSNTSSSNVKKVYLTDYVDKGFLGSTPYLVELSQDRFMVLWEEFQYDEHGMSQDKGVKYVEVDGEGQAVSDVKSLPNLKLSSDCQPIVFNNQVVWYVNRKTGRTFYQIAI